MMALELTGFTGILGQLGVEMVCQENPWKLCALNLNKYDIIWSVKVGVCHWLSEQMCFVGELQNEEIHKFVMKIA